MDLSDAGWPRLLANLWTARDRSQHPRPTLLASANQRSKLDAPPTRNPEQTYIFVHY